MAVLRAKTARQVGRYQLVYELGQSYLGPLWAARAEAVDGPGQLAVLRLVSLAKLDADTRVRLLEAAWQAMEVRHDRIASVSDVVASDGELGVLSDYVEGLPLRSLQGLASVRRKPFPVPIALAVIRDLVEAAAAMQSASVELGDESVPLFGGLSADSLLVGSDGRARVLDVGIAAVASTVESLGGHPERIAYAAPEQVSAPPRSDPRTDVFAVGVLAWELLSNRRLFIGSDKGVAQKVLTGKIPRLDEVKRRGDPDLPDALVAAIARALERDPAARFASVQELGAALLESAVAHAEPAEVAEYVEGVAEGALGRIRDALKDGASGTRTAIPTSPKPRPTAVVRAGGPPGPLRTGPALRDGRPPGVPVPANVVARAGRPALPVSAVGASVPLGGVRKRQHTMMGIAPPTPVSAPMAPGPDSAPVTVEPPTAPAPPQLTAKVAPEAAERPARENLAATRPAPRTAEPEPPEPKPPEPESVPPVPLSADFEEIPSIPPDPTAEEPTGQYDARALLKHVESMDRKSDVHGLVPSSRDPSTLPPPDRAPASSDFPEPLTSPRVDKAPAAVDPPASEGVWLDDPESVRPAAVNPPAPVNPSPVAPPPSPEPPRVEPVAQPAVSARQPERATQRPVSAPSTPPPSFLPSQVPPPLIHDPRANRATARPPRQSEAKARPRKGVVLGILVSVLLIGASAAIATVALRSRQGPPPEVAPAAATAAPVAEEPATAAAPPAPVAEETPPAASAAPEPEPAPEAQAATEKKPAPKAATKKPAPATKPLAPAPKRAPAKKKTRYVPSDI